MAKAPSISPERQLAAFIARYSPEIQTLFKKSRAVMRARLPGAIEFVYDNYNGLVIGYGPSDRPSEALFSIVARPSWVTLCFLLGAKLPDPTRRLNGGGNQVRHMRLAGIKTFEERDVRALMARALETAPEMLRKRKRQLQIRAVSERRLPRRPGRTPE